MGKIIIEGKGLAGTCLAWRLWQLGISFCLQGEEKKGASRVAAGFINPVTGKGMNPGWQQETFLTEAKEFYRDIESLLGEKVFYEESIHRVFRGPEEAKKLLQKREVLSPWIGREWSEVPDVPGGEWGGVEWVGGGWLDTKRFLDASWSFLAASSIGGSVEDLTVWCGGYYDMEMSFWKPLQARPAKGEILEIYVRDWNESRILNRNGWCLPLGRNRYRVGATYEWDQLDEEPTKQGREALLALARTFAGERAIEVLSHEAAVRPIIRNSRPLIGAHPTRKGDFFFNGLGSKGSLYAPLTADYLAAYILEREPISPDLDVAVWVEEKRK